MYNSTNQWSQAFDHWCLAVFLFNIRDCIKEWLVLCFSCPSLSPSLLTGLLRYWVYVCCFVFLYFGCYVMMLCMKINKNVDNKKKENSRLRLRFSIFRRMILLKAHISIFWKVLVTAFVFFLVVYILYFWRVILCNSIRGPCITFLILSISFLKKDKHV